MYAETRPTSLSSTDTRIPQILASPAAMQIRQLEALQNMARTAGAKVVFGESYHPQYPCPCHTALTPPPPPLRHFNERPYHFSALPVPPSPRGISLTLTLLSVPMNLGTMGAGGMDNVAQQMAASHRFEDGEGGPGPATNAGLISSMANI